MAFVKIIKNKSYFMRYQTKLRRRRQGKTDYYRRKRLITQDKDKYNTAKYRLVARITNRRIITQVVWSTIQGDRIFAQADSTQLRRYGLSTGLANYASAYATGLLIARRLLKKVNLDKQYQGTEKVDGVDYDVSQHEADRRPFKCILDVGLRAPTRGSKVFAVLKGACDGGLLVPHSTRKYPGYVKDGQNVTQNPEVHRQRIVGAHIDNYLTLLTKNNKPKSQLQFSKWTKALQAASAASVEKLYLKIHDEIRKNPDFAKKPAKKNPDRKHSAKRQRKIKAEQRHKRVQKKIEIALKQLKGK